MSLTLLAGCGGKDSTTDASGRVYWLNFKPESDSVLQEIAATYTEQTGVPVQVVTAASGTYSQTLIAEMDKSAPPTLFVIGNQDGVAQWKDYALDLTGSATSATASLSTLTWCSRPATPWMRSRTSPP